MSGHMNGTSHGTVERYLWIEEMIHQWRIEWLKAIDELLRPGVKS